MKIIYAVVLAIRVFDGLAITPTGITFDDERDCLIYVMDLMNTPEYKARTNHVTGVQNIWPECMPVPEGYSVGSK